MHAGDVIEQLRNANPARQHGDVGDERNIAHELLARGPRVAPEHSQFSLVCGQSENRIQQSGFARAVRPDDSKNAAFFHAKIDIVQRDRCSKNLAQTASFNRCHGSVLLLSSLG